MSGARRLALATAFILTRCASGTAVPGITEREIATGALAAYMDEKTVPLDLELFRTTVHDKGDAKRNVDFALARDPRNGLTFRTIVSVGDRPFPTVQYVMQSKEDVRMVEHDERMFAFSVVANGIQIREFDERYASMNAAEADALRWLSAHPEASDPNRIDIPRFVPFWQQVDGGFFTDPTTSQLKGVLLRDAAREGDHWLVTIEGPSRQIVTLVINDHDQLVEVRRRTP